MVLDNNNISENKDKTSINDVSDKKAWSHVLQKSI